MTIHCIKDFIHNDLLYCISKIKVLKLQSFQNVEIIKYIETERKSILHLSYICDCHKDYIQIKLMS